MDLKSGLNDLTNQTTIKVAIAPISVIAVIFAHIYGIMYCMSINQNPTIQFDILSEIFTAFPAKDATIYLH